MTLGHSNPLALWPVVSRIVPCCLKIASAYAMASSKYLARPANTLMHAAMSGAERDSFSSLSASHSAMDSRRPRRERVPGPSFRITATSLGPTSLPAILTDLPAASSRKAIAKRGELLRHITVVSFAISSTDRVSGDSTAPPSLNHLKCGTCQCTFRTIASGHLKLVLKLCPSHL